MCQGQSQSLQARSHVCGIYSDLIQMLQQIRRINHTSTFSPSASWRYYIPVTFNPVF